MAGDDTIVLSSFVWVQMELEDAIHTAILTLKEGFEGQMTENNIELSVIGVSAASCQSLIMSPCLA